jgi:exodeoxyribonuclease V beta subunit
MAKHAYFLQYLLYSAVLHRHLRKSLGERYSWERNFGGIRYCFLRGMAAGGEAPVFMDRPSEALLDDLCMALGMEAKA